MMPVRGVLADLDDTLHPLAVQRDLGWRAVARCGAGLGLDPDALLGALRAETAAGAERGGLLERALARLGAPTADTATLLAAIRVLDPVGLEPYPGVVRALAALRRRVPIALVADGEPADRERTLAALGLTDAFDAVVVGGGPQDRLGRALDALGLPAADVVLIADRPEDAAAAVAAGLRAVRVRTGDSATRPDHPATWLSAGCFAVAVRALLPALPAAADIPELPESRPSVPVAASGPPTEPAAAPIFDEPAEPLPHPSRTKLLLT
jgi:putative hydrolase of the HAD superfamily